MGTTRIKKADLSEIRYTPQEGEIMQNAVDDKFYIWHDDSWMLINVDNSGINMGLYDINKQIISQLPELTDLEDKHKSIKNIHVDAKEENGTITFLHKIKDGAIDRKYLGDLIFENRHLYKEMSDLIWDIMEYYIDYIIATHDDVILDWILLPHTHYWKMCDTKILMVADEEDRKKRVMARDNISAEYLSKRDSAGISYDNIEFDQIINTTRKETSYGIPYERL